MNYATYDEYLSIYGKSEYIESAFNRLNYEASRRIERQTTGIGYNKLREAFPTDEDAAEAVLRCCCKLINTMAKIEDAQNSTGFIKREDGTVMGSVVKSVSSGSESITYDTGNSSTVAAAGDKASRDLMYSDIISEYLSGYNDANGVPLLYMGTY